MIDPAEHSRVHYPGSAHALSFSLTLLLFVTLSGTIHFWDSAGTVISPAMRYSVIPLIIMMALAWATGGFSLTTTTLSPHGAAMALVVIFFTDWICRPYSLIMGPSGRGLIVLGILFAYPVISRKYWTVIPMFLLGAIGMFFYGFFDMAQGRLLFSDDHASMFYRLELLKRHFPGIPLYNPFWNAGLDARDFFATGVLNIFLLFSPVIYLFELASTYNIIVALTLFVIVPLASYLAARISLASVLTASITALLALSSSLLWYRWALKYGTMGFVLSAALTPLNVAIVLKVLDKRRSFSNAEALLAIGTISLMFLWSLSSFVFVPLLAFGVVKLGTVFRKRGAPLLLAGLLLVNLPWAMLFLSVSKVRHFVALEAPSTVRDEAEAPQDSANLRVVKRATHELNAHELLTQVREYSVKVNPLILFMALAGLPLLASRLQRWMYTATFGWLLLLGLVVPVYRPQLEMERMLVILALLAALPTAQAVSMLFQNRSPSPFLKAVAGGFLIAGILSVSGAIYRRTPEHYTFAYKNFHGIAKAVREHGGMGRTAFTGFVLHDVDGAHVAPMIYETGKPMLASSPFHNLWWYTDLIPEEFRKRGPEGIEEYFDLMNVTAVIAHEAAWRDYFEKLPEKYEAVWARDRFRVFVRKAADPSYFLEGSGEVLRQATDRVELKLNGTDAVLKFRYFPFLVADGCSVSGQNVASEIEFVKLSGCPSGQTITLRSVGPLGRLSQEFHG